MFPTFVPRTVHIAFYLSSGAMVQSSA